MSDWMGDPIGTVRARPDGQLLAVRRYSIYPDCSPSGLIWFELDLRAGLNPVNTEDIEAWPIVYQPPTDDDDQEVDDGR
jgi:hypothetical protein